MQLNDNFDMNLAQNGSEIDNYISKGEGLISEYFELSCKLKICFGEEYERTFEPNFKKYTQDMQENIKVGKVLKRKLLEVTENNKLESEQIERSKRILEAQNLFSEIDLRCSALQYKYELDLRNMSDYQLLEVSQNKNLDLEYN